MNESWINRSGEFDSVLAELPDIAAAYRRLYDSLWQQPYLPGEVLECCRLRLAMLHASAHDCTRHDFPLSEDKRTHLAGWPAHPAFEPGERACLGFTEVYAMDAQALTDELAEQVKQHYGDAGLVLLIEALGIFDGMARLNRLWGFE